MPAKQGNSLTQRQQKLLKLISENIGNPDGTKTMYEMMLEAGYEESTARQQSTILSGIREELQPVVQQMIDARTEAVGMLAKRIGKAKYRDLVDGIDKLTKNIQLLSGGKTARDELKITWQK